MNKLALLLVLTGIVSSNVIAGGYDNDCQIDEEDLVSASMSMDDDGDED